MKSLKKHRLEAKFEEQVIKRELINRQKPTLLAVSGGLDSMVMMHLYHRAGFPFAVAHCNFQLRGDESAADEKFVRKEARYLKAEIYVRKFETKRIAARHQLSIQAAARQLRYRFFGELCKRHGYDYCATAHHADDNAETFFIHLLRGTGITGESGIPVKQNCFVRPLLFASRNDLEEYAREFKIDWREDASNAADHYLRNRIRHHLMPVLDAISPSYRQVIERHIENMQGAAVLYKEYVEALRQQYVKTVKNLVMIDREFLAAHPAGFTLTFEFLHPYGFNRQTCFDIYRSLQSTPGKKFYSQTHQLITDRQYLMAKSAKAKASNHYEIKEDWHQFNWEAGSLAFRKIHLTFDLKEKIMSGGYTDPNVIWVDSSRLKYPLTLRKWQKGDEFHPLGMKGRKKLSDLFTDLKLSAAAKENAWLLVSGDRIMWVIGIRQEHSFRITPDTSACIEIVFEKE
jgi:tRNA(Ile)-lysidine synthase